MDVEFPRRPFSELKSLHPDSSNFSKQVEELSQKYSSWRDVRADGNCLYRCVARSLLEHLCRPFTDSCELEGLYKRFYYQEFSFVGNDEELAELHVVLNVLLQLFEWKKNNEEGLMRAVDRLLVTDAFMIPFINLMRRISYKAILQYRPPNVHEPMEQDLEMQNMLINGSLSGEYDYIGLGLAFDLDIQQIELGRNMHKTKLALHKGKREREGQDWISRLVLHIAFIEGSHYVFYPKGLEQLETVEEGRYRALVDITIESIKEYDRVMRAERPGNQDEE